MSYAGTSRIIAYATGGLIVIWLIATDWLCPLIARYTGVNAHDLQGICVLSYVLGMWIAGAILRTNPRLWYRWWSLGLWMVLLFALVWALFGSRTWAQLTADIEQHAAVVLLCVIVSVPVGMAVMYALNWVTRRLWPQPPPSTTNCGE